MLIEYLIRKLEKKRQLRYLFINACRTRTIRMSTTTYYKYMNDEQWLYLFGFSWYITAVAWYDLIRTSIGIGTYLWRVIAVGVDPHELGGRAHRGVTERGGRAPAEIDRGPHRDVRGTAVVVLVPSGRSAEIAQPALVATTRWSRVRRDRGRRRSNRCGRVATVHQIRLAVKIATVVVGVYVVVGCGGSARERWHSRTDWRYRRHERSWLPAGRDALSPAVAVADGFQFTEHAVTRHFGARHFRRGSRRRRHHRRFVLAAHRRNVWHRPCNL